MEQNSNNFTPEQSLELIGHFILNYRKNLRTRSFYFLLWGWIVIIASLSHFVVLTIMLKQQAYDRIGLLTLIIWSFFTLLGLVLTYLHSRSDSVKKEAKSHIDKFIMTLWRFTALSIILILFFCIKMNYFYPTPFILTIAGLATTVTGVTVKFRPVIFGGILFFIFAVIGSFITSEYQLLINAVALIFGYLIPGYMLRASKSE